MFDKKYQDFPTNHFDISDNIFVFRDGSGNIAVENPNKITIGCTPEDKVTLITLSNEKKSVSFWKVATNLTTTFYALTSSQPYTFPEHVGFISIYKSENYSEGFYVKYLCSDSCGILYISQTEISCVISHTSNYSDIIFENGMFYAIKKPADTFDNNTSTSEYHIINESGNLISKHDTEVRKVKGFQLYYDEKRILNDCFSQEIPGGIISVEVVNLKQSSVYTPKKFTFIRVTTKKGISYYTTSLELLFGPICEDKINIEPDGLFISEVVDGTITKVFFVGDDEKSGPFVKELFTGHNIEIYTIEHGDFVLHENNQYPSKNTFFKSGNDLYGYSHKENSFISIFKNVDISSYYFKKSKLELFSANYFDIILGYKDGVPVCFASYSVSPLSINQSDLLEIVDSADIDDKCKQYICIGKSSHQIVVVEERLGEMKVLFYTRIPAKCTLKSKVYSKEHRRPVYVVDFDESKFMCIDIVGKIED